MLSIPKFSLDCIADFQPFLSLNFSVNRFLRVLQRNFLGERGLANINKIIISQLFCQANYRVVIIYKHLYLLLSLKSVPP
jgi:hypothetical protein